MAQRTQGTTWPPITRECRPWTRWWWLGSAVDEAEVTRHLQQFREAGIGGVEISPIYGVPGAEARAIPFLSARWIGLLRHTLREAERLDMGVDMITGTGWPLGGAWVEAGEAAARVLFESYPVAGGGRVEAPIRSGDDPGAALLAVVAVSAEGEQLDLTRQVGGLRRLDWVAPEGEWRGHALFQAGTGQQVKRAGPGGEGRVLDHFSAAAVQRYLAHFEPLFGLPPARERLRGFFNDSFEVYGANWTGDLLEQFERRRGYDLRRHLPAIRGEGDAEVGRRVRSDYRQTIAELLLEAFVLPWTAWARERGAVTRNQAHGSPGNLLDLYAAVDIPETETFRRAWLGFAGLDATPGSPDRDGGRELILCGKLASSAAHVRGRRLCSSESCTWLGEHGQVSLEHARAVVDSLFVMGINHVFYHGTPLSPADAAWPGWLFYATTHFGPTNPFWRDLPALNAYIARCQAFLQSGWPDNDVLLYLPIFDLWAADHGSRNLLQYLGVHNTGQWLNENLPDFTAAGLWLWERGYGFDCVSDRLLDEAVHVARGLLQTRGGASRALVLAGCSLMPPETMERILRLVRERATVLVVGALPRDVPGLSDLEARRGRLREAISAMGTFHTVSPGVEEARVGKGRVLRGDDLEALLARAGIRRDPVVEDGIAFIRRREGDGWVYFLTNQGRQRLDGWVELAVPARTAVIFDPTGGGSGVASVRRTAEGHAEVYLQMDPGESLILRALARPVEGPKWEYLAPAGPAHPVEGEWQVEFIEGGLMLPPPARVRRLTSWTTWPDDAEALRSFSGAARYTLAFEAPSGSADGWALELGAVCHSARVTLNGVNLGTVYARPFRVNASAALRPGSNELVIEVTNLMANRLAALDRAGVPWHPFYFVNIDYKPFDASQWEPLPSGLLGPVQLVPLRRIVP